MTIHGAHELDPQFPQSDNLNSRLNRIRRRMSYQQIIDRADLILTVSDFLKNQMMDWFGCEENKIAVVGNGVEQDFFAAAELPSGVSGRPTDRPYLLCVGGLNEIDGGNQVIQAAQLLAITHPDIQIVIAGYQHEQKLLEKAQKLSNVELLGYVPAKALAPLMRDALALLYLTKYETFGIAAAESMAVGTPVITSGSTAVPEIVGDAGLYVTDDPHDVMEKISMVINDDKLYKSLHTVSRRRAMAFTWQACVDRLHIALEKGY